MDTFPRTAPLSPWPPDGPLQGGHGAWERASEGAPLDTPGRPGLPGEAGAASVPGWPAYSRMPPPRRPLGTGPPSGPVAGRRQRNLLRGSEGHLSPLISPPRGRPPGAGRQGCGPFPPAAPRGSGSAGGGPAGLPTPFSRAWGPGRGPPGLRRRPCLPQAPGSQAGVRTVTPLHSWEPGPQPGSGGTEEPPAPTVRCCRASVGGQGSLRHRSRRPAVLAPPPRGWVSGGWGSRLL